MKDVQCKKCRYLLKDKDGYNWCPNKTFVDDPDTDLIRDCEWYAVKTNADRIRVMTDEELAEWASIREMCFIYHLLINDPDLRNKCRIYENCKDCWLEWLKQETT